MGRSTIYSITWPLNIKATRSLLGTGLILFWGCSDLSQKTSLSTSLDRYEFQAAGQAEAGLLLSPVRFMSPRPLPSLSSKVHFDIELEWLPDADSENQEQGSEQDSRQDLTHKPYLTLLGFFNGFSSRDGLELKLKKVGSDLVFEIWTPGVRAPLASKIEQYFSRRSRIKLAVELHHQFSAPSLAQAVGLSRVLIWTDELDHQTGEARPRAFFTEASADFDSLRQNSPLGRGQGVFWGLEFYKVRLLKVERRGAWL
jgi:hypothetical protein